LSTITPSSDQAIEKRTVPATDNTALSRVGAASQRRFPTISADFADERLA
jgi:hypothetical protein